MAQILFTSLAGAATQAFGIGGIAASLLSTTAGIVGGFVDKQLFGKKVHRQVEGPRLDSLNILSATEGSPIIRGYGRIRVAGEIIWASRMREEIVTTTETTGGKGGGVKSTTVETTEYLYNANFAVGLCEGVTGFLNRVWADGKLLDLSEVTYRFYRGTETQNPDSLITTKEGAGNAPAYRGLSYVVFEDLLLKAFGNRIPQLQFEILKPIQTADAEAAVKGVNMIPGSTEFGYDTTIIEQSYGSEEFGDLEVRPENNYLKLGISDFEASLDTLQRTCPNLETVCLVVTWFGSDLRAGNCEIKPKVENDTKQTTPIEWAVAGLTRATADIVSQIDGIPAFGGTPNDESVKRAITEIKSRGLKVMFYPFIMMDIASGNTLANPYSDNAGTNGQPLYPWRGRITISPAAGYAGTVDKTSTAATQIATFFNTTWGYENFVLHYANLCNDAGGVDYFCIGSELVGLTQARSDSDTYPFVETHLTDLAASVAAILTATELGYAADWSEYHSHRPDDGSGDVFFNMDALWSDSNIDFIGIDNYLPLADWRDDPEHLDGAAYPSTYDLDYLKSNIEGGEYYDWHYASAADRNSQTRTTINDAAEGKHWVYRNKDIKNWWLSAHYNRPGGTESATPTGWTAESKPIYFTELGCPAIDKGANQPNVFYDPKSSESFFPYFSSGARDDIIQRQALLAQHQYWADNANNPASGVYSGRMIDTSNIYVWSWDARPIPAFPYVPSIYADGANWERGHWISNRFGTVPAQGMLEELIADYGLTAYSDFSRAYGSIDGYVIDRVMSLRDAIGPLELALFFDFVETGGVITARSRHELNRAVTITADEVVAAGEDIDAVIVRRSQTIDIPARAKLLFINADSDFKSAAVEARRMTVPNARVAMASIPAVLDMNRAQQAMERWLYSLWGENEDMRLGAFPELLGIEAGDVIAVPFQGELREVRVNRITDGAARRIEALSFDRGAYSGSLGAGRTFPAPVTDLLGPAAVVFMDLPMLQDSDIEYQGYVAGYATPWGGVSIYRSLADANYQLNTLLSGPAVIGVTHQDFYGGPAGRWDYGNDLYVTILSGTLSSAAIDDVLGGANACAVQNADGEWEIVQFVTAELEDTLQYKLSQLLRGQRGTENAMRHNPDYVAAGARVIFFNLAVRQIAMETADVGIEYYFKYGPSALAISSDRYQTQQMTFTGLGRRPYSPDHVKGVVEANDDITLTWIRRTRIDGDNWEYSVDVPLAEESEQYEIDIIDNDGTTVLRTLIATNESATYLEADQITDWSGLADDFEIIVYQISASYGRGAGRRSTIWLEGFR